MATNQRWLSAAKTVAQIGQITFATYDVATTYGILINGKAITQIGTGGTITATVAALLALIQTAQATEGDFAEMTFSANAGVLTYTVTSSNAGKPVTVTGTVSGGTGTQTPAAVTANSGPSVWDIIANWTSAIPVATDSVYLDNSTVPVLYDLSQAGATVAAINYLQSFTGTVGLPKVNRNGLPYNEYRTDYLTLDATLIVVGRGPGRGSGRIKHNSGTVLSTVNVENTGTPAEQGLEAFLWKGTNASNAMNVTKGSVGVAVFGGETATLNTLNVDGGSVRIGAGVTLNTVVVNGGTVEINCAIVTSLTVNGGVVTINGTGACAALTVNGGTVYYNTTGTLGGAPLVLSGLLSFDRDPRTKTVTNPIDVYVLPGVVDSDAVVTSLVVDFNGVEAIRGLGKNKRWSRTATA